MPDLRLEEEAHVLRVRVEVGVGGEGVVAHALQALPHPPAPRARVRRLTGLFKEAVGELQRQEALGGDSIMRSPFQGRQNLM